MTGDFRLGATDNNRLGIEDEIRPGALAVPGPGAAEGHTEASITMGSHEASSVPVESEPIMGELVEATPVVPSTAGTNHVHMERRLPLARARRAVSWYCVAAGFVVSVILTAALTFTIPRITVTNPKRTSYDAIRTRQELKSAIEDCKKLHPVCSKWLRVFIA